MNNFITYILEVNVCILLFGALYYLLLRNETDFKFRRFYLISAAIIALMAPIFKLGAMLVGNVQVNELPITILPELVIGEQTVNALEIETTTNYLQYSSIVYWIIAGLLFQYFLFQLMQVVWFTFSKKTSIKKENGIIWIETNGTLPTFSFFNLLFYDNSIELTATEKERIVNHELAHIKQKHSWDIVLLEASKILCWINPLAWYMRREIQDIHEYLADEKVVAVTNSEEYRSLLAKMALNQAHLSIGHHFNKSKTLKRIQMITTIKEKVKRWKMALTLPALLSMAIIVSCNDEVMQDLDTVMETASQMEVPANLTDEYKGLVAKFPTADIVYMEVAIESEEEVKNLKSIDPKSIMSMHVFKESEENKRIGMFLDRSGNFQKLKQHDPAAASEAFTIVDEPAVPEGGYQAYYERIAKRLKYPQQARKAGVQGKVYVQFIVNEVGEITEVTAVKGIGAGCDQAAIDAVSASSKWSAPRQNGKAVKQRIILPISFSLGDEEGNTATLKIGDNDNSKAYKPMMVDRLIVKEGIIHGTVTNHLAKPLPGVNIVVKGTTIGTVSDLNGNFKLEAPKDVAELEFSFVGMETMVLKMNK
ncbi:M56 family metallopeptidase [Fulvivirga lutimaris]|uniref:M56 family metallopeptidase n=1 Tax=Fulvivirga lutimaris TaxID=1819566 RepID=UPI0012BB4F90|nr:M56 family metallopeptidase [Fulvivirga lutimaris]MTI38692.1 TonB family protein [Fulvivirga lutimaris]